MSLLYKEIILSKDNLQIPVLKSGKTMHSKYAPLKEAENFGTQTNSTSTYTIILGLGGGYHIESFARRNPLNTILVIEESCDDISFLSEIDCITKLKENNQILIKDKKQISSTLMNTYFPAIHGGIEILVNRPWLEENQQSADQIINEINNTLKEISRDYSVQCHFGAIWQKNIISNLKILSENKFNVPDFDTSKTAAIIAAGPSLDFSITKILNNRNQYVIFSTDTALDVLTKNKIKVDAVVSIDGQNISYKHFIGHNDPDTFFIFDLQANYNAVGYAATFTKNIVFVKSGHPLCNYAERTTKDNQFIEINCGAGTVTIGAIDFAKKIGFNTFEVFGADFSYRDNKPYTKGTYLDTLYRFDESKLITCEGLFTNLLYRTEVKKHENIIETDILNSYRETFIQWILKNNFKYTYSDNIYSIYSYNKYPALPLKPAAFSYNTFMGNLVKDKSLLNTKENYSDFNSIEVALLPYIAFLRFKNPTLNYKEALNLAYTKIVEYN